MQKPLTMSITINCGKFWKMGIPDHLTCLLRNLYAGQEAAVRTRHGTTDWLPIGKGVHQGCILSPCLFNFYAEYIIQNVRLDVETVTVYFLGLQNHCRWWLQPQIKRCLLLGRNAMANLDGVLKSRDIILPTKGFLVKVMDFLVVMYRCWKLDHKESWVLRNWCFPIVVLEKTLESPLDNKEIKPVNPKGNQPWIFFGRTEADVPILWPPDVKNWLIEKDPDAGEDWRWRRRVW